MKNTQNTTKRTDLSMTIPSPILEGSGIAEAKCAELHQLRHCVAVLQGKMTTYELIEAIESISGLAESLTTHLADVCGICGGCDACNETLEGEQEIKIPPELLDELNIPRSAKLEAYTDPAIFLQVIKDELPYKPTSGFQYKVLTDDPAVRKGADDILYDLFGEKNPRPLEDYEQAPEQSMTMGGM